MVVADGGTDASRCGEARPPDSVVKKEFFARGSVGNKGKVDGTTFGVGVGKVGHHKRHRVGWLV